MIELVIWIGGLLAAIGIGAFIGLYRSRPGRGLGRDQDPPR